MRDAFGGLMNMVIIVVFLVLVSGYLAFNVNYTKAYHVKNKIITTIEQYEGACEPGPMDNGNACNKIIKEYMNSVGYNASNIRIDGYQCHDQAGYCIKAFDATAKEETPVISSDVSDLPKKVYYKVSTAIVVDIPIINKIMPNLKIFQVSGTTKTFVPSS